MSAVIVTTDKVLAEREGFEPSVVLYGKGIIKNYDEFILSVLEKQECKIYHPDEKESERYDLLFERFKRIYPSIKNCF